MEMGTRIGIKFTLVGLGIVALVLMALSRPSISSAAVVNCGAGGGDRRDQNRIDAVQLTATANSTDGTITLSWPAHNSSSHSYNIYRKARNGTDWGTAIATANAATTTYVDTTVALGDANEYRVQRVGNGCTNQNGYIYAGLEAELIDQQGAIVLIVENTYSGSLANELALFEQDLRGDGWDVIRHDVQRMPKDMENINHTDAGDVSQYISAVAEIKGHIQTAYDNAPDQVKAVFIVGHVAIPYSGHHATDGHNRRAWPADVYYGDMDGNWTDNWNNGANDSNPNIRNDGVWDQTTITPSATGSDTAPELMVGRIDMANMLQLKEGNESLLDTELRLLKNYFEKNHAFRHGETRVRQRAIVMDKFGEGSGWETPGVAQWTGVAPLVGSDESWFDGDSDNNGGQFTDGVYMMHFRKDKFFNDAGYIFADVSGPAITNEMFDSYKTVDYVTDTPPVIFYNKFGSYFGDWDQWDNLLRASLAGQTYGLAAAWGGWGTWSYHHMGLGEPIGNTIVATHMSSLDQSSGGDLYATWYSHTRPEMSLMGDPTLQMHIVDPPHNLNAQVRGAQLSWNASPDAAVAGYHVYRADSPTGAFARLTNQLVTATSYVDGSAETGEFTYMVRAVKLEVTPSGSYFNASQGVFLTTQTMSVPTVVELVSGATQSEMVLMVTALIYALLVGMTAIVYNR